MKKKYYLLLFSILFVTGVIGCSDDEHIDNTVVPEPVSDLIIEATDVDVTIGNIITIDIATGNEDYQIFSLNPEVATAQIIDGQIVIEGIIPGRTAAILSDKNDQYQRIAIRSFYDQIVVDREDVIYIKTKKGQRKQEKIKILGGNGDYTIVSDNEKIMEITKYSSWSQTITIEGFQTGIAHVIIRDALDVERIITVEIEASDIPFTDEEIETIKNLDRVQYVYDEIEEFPRSPQILNKQQDGFWINGYYENSNVFMEVHFPDKEVGKKQGCKFRFASWPYQVFVREWVDLDKFEIVKNDGTKIWAVFSYVLDDVLHYGYFIADISSEN